MFKKIFNKKIVYFIISLFFIACIGFICFNFHLNNKLSKWSDKAYPGVYINNIDVSCKTKNEIILLLNEKLLPKINETYINFKIYGNILSYSYNDLSINYNINEIAEKAIGYGKNLSKYKQYKLINNKKKLKSITFSIIYDEVILDKIIAEIIDSIKKDPIDAKIEINNGEINIIPEEVGYKLNKDSILNSIKEAITTNEVKDIYLDLKVEEIPAKITTKDLGKIKGVMGTFQSSYATSSDARSTNIEIATSLVDGTIIMPGEEFSYSKITEVGRGDYELAPGYMYNTVVQVEGGGICQVCTALYRAIMRCNIKALERHSHSKSVSYTRKGLDATVSWGSLDYRFINPYNFPIYIQGKTYGKTIYFTIYGNPDVFEGRSYELISEINGDTATAYLLTYLDGEIIFKELISKDKYK